MIDQVTWFEDVDAETLQQEQFMDLINHYDDLREQQGFTSVWSMTEFGTKDLDFEVVKKSAIRVRYQFVRNDATIEEINAEIETDRYIAWPGQACSYKMGQLKIEELRRKAENELGDKFDIRYFHDEVLCDGGITLPILENKIKEFIQRHSV